MPRYKLSLLDPDPYTLEEHSKMDKKTLEEFEGISFDTSDNILFLISVLSHVQLTTLNPKWKIPANLLRLLQSNQDLRVMLEEAIKSKQFATIRSICEYPSDLSLYII